MAENIVEAFTQLAPRYERTMDRELRFMWGLGYRDFVIRLVQTAEIADGDRVLDIATGTAAIPQGIGADPERRAHILGLDITPAMLQHGARDLADRVTHSRIDLVCGSAMALALADDACDAVLCGLGMHHLDVAQTFAEIRRVLAPGGTVVMGLVGIPDFWRTRWGEKLLSGGIRAFYRMTHGGPRADAELEAFYNLHTGEEWCEFLCRFGFADVQIEAVPSRFGWGPNALFVRARLVDSGCRQEPAVAGFTAARKVTSSRATPSI